jgi:hypothetical protein
LRYLIKKNATAMTAIPIVCIDIACVLGVHGKTMSRRDVRGMKRNDFDRMRRGEEGEESARIYSVNSE